jgi:hypothetical protein
MNRTPGYPCPCCGYRTLPGPSPTDDICPVCFWQDDFVDSQDTDVLGHALPEERPHRFDLSVGIIGVDAQVARAG